MLIFSCHAYKNCRHTSIFPSVLHKTIIQNKCQISLLLNIARNEFLGVSRNYIHHTYIRNRSWTDYEKLLIPCHYFHCHTKGQQLRWVYPWLQYPMAECCQDLQGEGRGVRSVVIYLRPFKGDFIFRNSQKPYGAN
jgi:hypothetical protein